MTGAQRSCLEKMSVEDPAPPPICQTVVWAGGDVFHHYGLSLRVVCRRADPEIMRTSELPSSSLAAAFRKASPAPHLNIIAMLTLASAQVSSPKGVRVGELVPLLICCVVGWAREKCPPTLHPHHPHQAGEQALGS